MQTQINTLILVLNLESAEDRRVKVKRQLQGIDFTFINAIDGRAKVQKPDSLITPPVEAIWQSHLKAYRHFLSTDNRFCVILEDDFLISDLKNVLIKIEELERFYPDVVQLGWLETGIDIKLQKFYEGVTYLILRALNRLSRHSVYLNSITSVKFRSRRALESPSFVIPDSFLPGAHGYVISRKYAESALLLNQPTFLAADDFLMSLSRMRSFNFMRLRKSLIEQQGQTQVDGERFTRS